MAGGCVYAVCVVAIMSIGLLITAGALTGKRLLHFIGRLVLLMAGIFAAYWILELLLIPGTIRVFQALKQMAAGLAYMAFAIILLFGIAHPPFLHSRNIHTARHIGKRRNYETVFEEITTD